MYGQATDPRPSGPDPQIGGIGCRGKITAHRREPAPGFLPDARGAPVVSFPGRAPPDSSCPCLLHLLAGLRPRGCTTPALPRPFLPRARVDLGRMRVACPVQDRVKYPRMREAESVKSLSRCLALCNSMDYSPPGSSVQRILQARILEWAAIPFSRRSSQPRDRTWLSCIAGRFFTV